MTPERKAALNTARETVKLAEAAETLFSNARRPAETITALEADLYRLKASQAELIGQATWLLPRLAARAATLAEADSDDPEVAFIHFASRRTLESAIVALLAVSEGPAA